MRYVSGLFRTIFQSPEDTSTCLIIVRVRILATYFLQTRKTFVQSFIRFIAVKKRRGLIALILIGASTIVGFTLRLELLGKFGENKKCMAQRPLLLSPSGLQLRGGTL
jgi:hypothetical protein